MQLHFILALFAFLFLCVITCMFADTLHRIERKLDTMAKTEADESAALTATETTVAAVVKDVADEIKKFLAAQSAGHDTTAFVDRINTINTALQGVDQGALDAAGATVPVVLPPPSPTLPPPV